MLLKTLSGAGVGVRFLGLGGEELGRLEAELVGDSRTHLEKASTEFYNT